MLQYNKPTAMKDSNLKETHVTTGRESYGKGLLEEGHERQVISAGKETLEHSRIFTMFPAKIELNKQPSQV